MTTIEVKGIFFDLGGTLLFPNPEHIARIFSKFFQPVPSPNEWLKAIHHATVILDYSLGSDDPPIIDWWLAYFKEMFPFLGLHNASSPKITEFIEALKRAHNKQNLWCYPALNVSRILSELQQRGFYLGIISNSDGRLREQLKEHNLLKFFRFHLDSKIVGCSKPDPEIFEIALKISGFAPQDVVYVGDFANIDGKGARNVKMHSIIIDPLNLRKECPYTCIRDLSELLTIVAKGTKTSLTSRA